MPYCPKCDMEYVDGVAVCSDCGGPLAESREAALAIKQKEHEELIKKQREYARMLMEQQEMSDSEETAPVSSAAPYVKKSEQYEDLRSSASALSIVGGITLAACALGLTGILPLPLYGISRYLSLGVMAAIGIACLAAAVTTLRSAKKVKGQIAQEDDTTRQLVEWFANQYTGEGLDRQIEAESPGLQAEELSLKRFSLIQDILITAHDITDQSYVDLISEEIYGKLFEDAS